jgi:hypothetical protein
VEDALLRQLDAADADLLQRFAGQATLRVALDQDGDVAGRQRPAAERQPARLRRAQQSRHFAGGGVQRRLLRFGAQQVLAIRERAAARRSAPLAGFPA